ncbi:MAG: hypothetical protein QXU18_10005, partial [Thermoplasmatales archaeon]
MPLIALFYDTFNINADIFSTENLILGLNPYMHQSLLVIGFTALPYNLLITTAYTISDYNVYFVIIIIKAVAAVFTLGSGILIYMILLENRVSSASARQGYLAFIFSPFI